MGWNYLLIHKLNGATAEVWEWISHFIPYFIRHAITYPCWDQSLFVLVKGLCGTHAMKTPSYQYRDSHYKYETVANLSYLYNGYPYAGKKNLYIMNRPRVHNPSKP